jgi:DNA-binding winged helix-turn-helix (wHTH) protein
MPITVANALAHQMRLSFGPFTVDLARRVVLRDGAQLRLTLKCVELLIALVRCAGQTLTKEDLIQAAWHDGEASDATLAQHIFLLRRALTDSGAHWIKTIPNTGYRFEGRVRIENEPESSRSQFLLGAKTFASLMTEQGLRSAIDLYARLLAMDDTHAAAYAGRAECLRLLAQFMYADPLVCLADAKRDALRALERDPYDADALIEAAYAHALLDRDPGAAAGYASRAQSAQPAHPELLRLHVSLHLMRGDIETALSSAAESGVLRGTLLYLSRDYARARQELSAHSGDPLVRIISAACRLFAGEIEAARDEFHAVYHAEIDLRHIAHRNVRHYALACLIFANARLGDVAAARRGIMNLARLARERYVSPMVRAIAHAGLNERDEAISFVEEAVAHVDPWTAHIGVDPFLDDLRSDVRFTRLEQIVAGALAA